MSKGTTTALAMVASALAIAAPTVFAINLARRQGIEGQTRQVLSYARDVLHRSDETADQILDGTDRLAEAVGTSEPCSVGNLELMRDIDVAYKYIQAIGFVANERLMCSSLGLHGDGIPLGPADAPSPLGVTQRLDVTLPFSPATPLMVFERKRFAVIVHKDLPIDVSTDETDAILATIMPERQLIRSSRGHVQQSWLTAVDASPETTFVDRNHVVAVVKSPTYSIGAVAALPLSYVDRQARQFALLLVPIGVVSGLVLAVAILLLARAQLALPAVIKVALKRNEFFLAYQPIVDLRTGQWVGAEALIRWRRPSGEVIRPDLFIPVAEDSGLIQRITARVTELLARDVKDLFQRYPNFHIAINLSPADIVPETVVMLRTLARETRAWPGNLSVEATERGLLNADETKRVIRDFRASGIRVAIDDFGTGYSSLSYLETFELDLLKIDKAFISSIGTGAPTSQVVLHVIRMARDLKLEMIAEGVETQGQARFLREHGVQYAQGWLYAKPMSMTELARTLAANVTPASLERISA